MKKQRRSYNKLFKEKAVQLSCEKKNIGKLEKELGLYPGAIYNWKIAFQKAQNANIEKDKPLKEGSKIQILELKIKRSELKYQFFKSALKYIDQGNEILFSFMLESEKEYPVRLMCEAVNFNRDTYYTWKNQTISNKKTRKKLIKKEIVIIFHNAKRRYGTPRIKVELQNLGYKVARKTIKKYMKELNLECKV
ncbi:IS3 family transposase [Flavobacterium sp. 22076]|jgi:transposase-like protein|uniref:IS3 family transposase n=1 Tax=unclassified Flavobacterium TaxID=196869 RepID=UPI003F8702FE